MKIQTHKLIAPVIITAAVSVYCVVIGIWGADFLDKLKTAGIVIDSIVLKLLFFVVPAFIMGIMIYILIERIKEIRSGKEDDLGKY